MKRFFHIRIGFILGGFKYGWRWWFDPVLRRRLKNRRHQRARREKYGMRYEYFRRSMRKRIFGTRTQGYCVACRGKFSVSELTIDHIIPVSQGGKNKKNNIQVLCHQCHANKDNQVATYPHPRLKRTLTGRIVSEY